MCRNERRWHVNSWVRPSRQKIHRETRAGFRGLRCGEDEGDSAKETLQGQQMSYGEKRHMGLHPEGRNQFLKEGVMECVEIKEDFSARTDRGHFLRASTAKVSICRASRAGESLTGKPDRLQEPQMEASPRELEEAKQVPLMGVGGTVSAWP